MARLGLLDGLKRWKLPIDNGFTYNRLRVRKEPYRWYDENEHRYRNGSLYSWSVSSDTHTLTVQIDHTITYRFRPIQASDMYPNWLIITQKSIRSVSGEGTAITTYTDTRYVINKVVEWFKNNRIKELMPFIVK